jgi:hypothetical protein
MNDSLSPAFDWPRLRRVLFSVLFGFACFAFLDAAKANVIEDENLQPGTTAWQLTNPADNRQIEGYASLTSVPVGGDIDLFVNTQDLSYLLTVYRMGWYGGKGGRQVLGPQTRPGVHQVTPTADPVTGLIECNWTDPFRINVPGTWVSGIYLVKLHGNTSGKESYITFTVRDTRNAAIVFQQSVTTYQAYNPWPGWDLAGGYVGASLYGYSTNAHIPSDSYATINRGQATQVSFNRPYGRGPVDNTLKGVGAGDFLTHDFSPNLGPEANLDIGIGGASAWEFGMVRWLEHHAYDVTYITNVDTEEDVNRLLRGKAFLSVGHDEYWSEQMKTNVTSARDQGVNLGFFSGNYVYWPVTLLPDSSGHENRTLALAPKSGKCGPATSTPCDDNNPCPTNLVCQNGACTMPCSVNSDCPTNLTCQSGACAPAKETHCSVDSDCPTNLTCIHKDCDFFCMNESEQLLVGGMWDGGHLANGDIVVPANAPLNHWVFANTGLQAGDVIPGLIGYEYDAFNSGVASPSGLQILLQTQAPDFEGPGRPFPPDFDGKSFDAWYSSLTGLPTLDTTCNHDPISPFGLAPPAELCSNPFPQDPFHRTDWAMTIYQVSSGAYVFNAGTVEWSWGLDDYFTGLTTADGANNGPEIRNQCGYRWFHPGLVSCRNDAIAQMTRNVLNKFQPADTTAPQSTLTIGTPQFTGSQLFVAAATPFTLTATDDATGVWNVWYRFFPSGSSAPGYTSFDGFSASFNLSGADGLYEVDTYATDNAGNDETPVHVQSVYLDTTPPVATITAPLAKQYLHSDTFMITYSVTDGNGSGVKSAVPDIDGQTTLHDGTTTVTVANNLIVKLLTELTLGTHTFNLNSVDNVDNADTATVTFSIIVTAQSIIAEVKYFRSIGAITQDEATSLLQKLSAAAAYRAKHDCRDANAIYKNFINELRAQTGKKVTAQAASILITDAQYLIAHCP